jgi:hypothetical protein
MAAFGSSGVAVSVGLWCCLLWIPLVVGLLFVFFLLLWFLTHDAQLTEKKRRANDGWVGKWAKEGIKSDR